MAGKVLMPAVSVSTIEVAPVLRRMEKTLGRRINPAILSEKDFVKSIAQRNHFLLTVMKGKKIMLKGAKPELEVIPRSA